MNLSLLRKAFDTLEKESQKINERIHHRRFSCSADQKFIDLLMASYSKKILTDFRAAIHSEAMSTDERVLNLKRLFASNWSLVSRSRLGYTAIPRVCFTVFLELVAQQVAEAENQKGCGLLAMTIAPRDTSEVLFAGYNSVCIRVCEQEESNLFLLTADSMAVTTKEDAFRHMDLTGYTAGYLRLKRGESSHIYYINVQKGQFIQLMTSKKDREEFERHACIIGDSGVFSSSSSLSVFAKRLHGHPDVKNALYYANQQQKVLMRLNCSPAQLLEFDNTPHPAALPFDNIPSYCGNLREIIEPLIFLDILMPGVSFDRLLEPIINASSNKILVTHIQSEDGERLIPVRCLAEPTSITPSTEEYHRLTQHSVLTQAILAAQQAYDSIASDTSTLLGQLNELCRQLGVNDAHGGRGQPDNAASGAYPAIIQFMSYYNLLPLSEQALIPANLQQEIETLLSVTADSSRNINATMQMETCIGTRKSALLKAMTGHDNALTQISLNGKMKASLITAAKDNLESAKLALINALEEGTYITSNDNLGAAGRLLRELNIAFSIDSPRDLNIFNSLFPEEINELLESKTLRAQVIAQLRTLDGLVLFLMRLRSDQLNVWIAAMKSELISRFIRSFTDLGALLTSLDIEKCRQICLALNSELPQIIKHKYNFYLLLSNLSPEHRTMLLQVCGDWIETANDFCQVLRYMTTENTMVFELMESKLPSLIENGKDFADVLKHLTIKQRTRVFRVMSDKLPALIQTSNDFISVLMFLQKKQRAIVFDWMRGELSSLIKSSYSFRLALHFLDREQRAEVFALMEDQLPSFIESSSDFEEICRLLTKEQRSVVFMLLIQKKLEDFIKTQMDLNCVLMHLSLDERGVVIDSIKSKLEGFIKTPTDLIRLSKKLNTESRVIVFESIKSKLPYMIKTVKKLAAVLEKIDDDVGCIALINSLSSTLLEEHANRLSLLLFVEPRLSFVVCFVFPELIDSIDTLLLVIKDVHLIQREDFYSKIKPRLPYILKKESVSEALLDLIPAQEREFVSKLPALISFLSEFSVEQDIVLSFASTLFCDEHLRIPEYLSYFPGCTVNPSMDPLWKVKIEQVLSPELLLPQRTTRVDKNKFFQSTPSADDSALPPAKKHHP